MERKEKKWKGRRQYKGEKVEGGGRKGRKEKETI